MRQLYEYHPIVGYRYIPNLRARIPHEGGGYLMQVNEHGFRSDQPFVKARTPGHRRVLVFGDSFTAGNAVMNRQRYTELLETRLGSAGAAPVDIYNFGLSSTGTDQQYLIWREFAKGIEHDLVVIAVFVENIRRVVAQFRLHHDEHGRERVYAKPYYELDDGRLNLRQVPPRREPYEDHELSAAQRAAVDQGGRFLNLRRLAAALGIREMVQKVSKYQPVPHYDSPSTPSWQLMRAILAQWVGAIDKPVLLMPLPLPQHLDQTCDASAYQARFTELSDELGCYLHDPLPDLLNIEPAERRRLRWPKDIHFTPTGHAALAQSLETPMARILAHLPIMRDTHAAAIPAID
ncbi:SGNH/GDSL hydrolase family protein [Massilia sp. TWR1-2-2]|uniref:SGNH/GDSL hydrolase family protein n=1 Tax=Massilia sp. TWR1-2-2 TaxID=2804584 RepID=UPI003CEA92DD